MLINQTFEIDSCDDVELGIKRTSKLEYRISYDNEKDIKAIVFMIGSYGTNMNMSIMDFDRHYIAQKFDAVVINVVYWCFGVRMGVDIDYSAQLEIQDKDLIHLKKTLEKHGLETFGLNANTAKVFIQKLDLKINALKLCNKQKDDYRAIITGTLIPPNNEYQNYGIMAAIDHINALKDLVKRFPKFADLPKIYGGVSYGGYLSLLIAKIAPWHVDAIIDNSGEALLLLQYIIGRDLNQCEFIIYENNIQYNCFLKTHWNINSESIYCFKTENYVIRALLNAAHLQIQVQKNKEITYVSYHSSADLMSSVEDKIKLIQAYKALGYEVEFNLIDNKNIDGKFIKNFNHGGGIAIKALFKKELPKLIRRLYGKNFKFKQDIINYPCGDKNFIFKDKDDKFELEITN
ncbi:DUF2920 family protein [Campylobacter jejuni]|uniref:DUF2920 family protein n=1 Tax=Campylobacter jejuni TaxID=197 RepID=UPI0005CE43ED|nr:DUF2920 family protein [Campylobacter jejuni]AXL34225.1 carbonic anhydrase [Campylobacter jejuni]EDO8477641.1 DUF2920 family protein [Campylobacter jejuni]KJD23410.1 carbonic anhydrase [Campylobacter jejuni subsp. jejuni]OEW89548.1 carbonic anhydrase [Campylobacter jejuni]RTH83698.1 DUF2920 domain-containing protein [Campylobacter jejuni]